MTVLLSQDRVQDEEDERRQIERIEDLFDRRDPWTLTLTGPHGECVNVPDSLQQLVRQLVRVLARGEAVSIVPVHKELTTQQAADLLNVSRQYLVRLLDEEKLPYHRVGTHRRIKLGDVMRHKCHRDRERRRSHDDLTRMSQELSLYE